MSVLNKVDEFRNLDLGERDIRDNHVLYEQIQPFLIVKRGLCRQLIDSTTSIQKSVP